MAQRIQHRRGTSAQWAAANPTLATGEIGYDITTRRHKMGDGTSAWSALPWSDVGGQAMSDTAATTQGQALLWTGSAWAPTSDPELADAVRSAGTVTGGVIRQATSIIIPWTYTQTVAPTDPAIGTALLVQWYATLNDATPFVGPQAQTGWWGPRGVISLEGRVDYGANQTSVMIEPIGYYDGLRAANTPGDARTITPGWSYVAARMLIGDGAKLTLQANDTNDGGASFVDSKGIFSINSGEVDGSADHNLTGFLSAPLMMGNVDIARRVGFDVKDICRGDHPYFLGGTWADIVENVEGLENLDTDTSVCAEQVGLHIRQLARATRNIGIQNDSATVETPLGSTIASAASTVRIDATTVVLTNTSGAAVTLTSVPTIAAGLDGQRLTIINESTDPVTIQGEATLTGSNVAVSRTLRQGRPVTLVWNDSLDQWCEVGAHQDNVTVTNGTKTVRLDAQTDGGSLTIWKNPSDTFGTVYLSQSDTFGYSGLSMGAGGASGPDTILRRASGGVWSIEAGGLTGIGKGAQFTEQSAPSSPAANDIVLYAADSSGTTVLRTKDSAGTVTTIGAAASDVTPGIVELGTDAETQTGTDATRAPSLASAAATFLRKLIPTGTFGTVTHADGGQWRFFPVVGVPFFTMRRTGDTVDRALLSESGVSFGDGTNGADVAIDRSSAGVMAVTGAVRFTEQSDPSAPAANTGVIFCRDNGSGKTQFCVRFASGAVQVIATEP